MVRYPDLVQGTKLDTSFADGHTVHEYDDSEDEECLNRPRQRAEYWATERLLTEGGFGEVYLQRCIKGARRVEWRAVKVLSKRKSRAKRINYVTELEAIAKFSQKRVSIECGPPLSPPSRANQRMALALDSTRNVSLSFSAGMTPTTASSSRWSTSP